MNEIKLYDTQPSEVEIPKDTILRFINPPAPELMLGPTPLKWYAKLRRGFHIAIILGIGITYIILKGLYVRASNIQRRIKRK